MRGKVKVDDAIIDDIGIQCQQLKRYWHLPAKKIKQDFKENDVQKRAESLCKKRIDKMEMPTKSK